jgi:tRNA threonylcarbamoyladenosine biosynthesis protein TsaE
VEIESSSPSKTMQIAGRLAAQLQAGNVVTVAGELGSGKTTFVRGACRALGIETPVASPTFTIGRRYPGSPDVSHLDLYRFASVSSAEWGDLEPYFEDAIVFVEWPEAAAATLRDVRASVRLAHVDSSRRLISVEAEESLLEKAFGRAAPRV